MTDRKNIKKHTRQRKAKTTKISKSVKSTKTTKNIGKKNKSKSSAKTTKSKGVRKTKVAKNELKVRSKMDPDRIRYFKVFTANDIKRGRYRGYKPKQAASKAYTALITEMKKRGENINEPIVFRVIECTRGQKPREYVYKGARMELANPAVVEVGEGDKKKVITYKFQNKLTKYRAPEPVVDNLLVNEEMVH